MLSIRQRRQSSRQCGNIHQTIFLLRALTEGLRLRHLDTATVVPAPNSTAGCIKYLDVQYKQPLLWRGLKAVAPTALKIHCRGDSFPTSPKQGFIKLQDAKSSFAPSHRGAVVCRDHSGLRCPGRLQEGQINTCKHAAKVKSRACEGASSKHSLKNNEYSGLS